MQVVNVEDSAIREQAYGLVLFSKHIPIWPRAVSLKGLSEAGGNVSLVGARNFYCDPGVSGCFSFRGICLIV